MSANKAKPHILVLPEDQANRKLADSFHLQVDWNRQRQMQVLPEAGGWTKVLEQFQTVHVQEMEKPQHRQRYMILLIDLDNDIKGWTEPRRGFRHIWRRESSYLAH